MDAETLRHHEHTVWQKVCIKVLDPLALLASSRSFVIPMPILLGRGGRTETMRAHFGAVADRAWLRLGDNQGAHPIFSLARSRGQLPVA
eukprot:2796154-Pyramimonas_sp.AAC.1